MKNTEYIEAPKEYEGHGRSIFLAGSITGASDWQSQLVRMLGGENIVILNPRRKSFPINDPKASEAQISWEHKYLRRADAIAFWFSKETLAPITLYELGTWSMTSKPILIGIDPGYKRRSDVEIQTRLARNDALMAYSLESLSYNIKVWIRATSD